MKKRYSQFHLLSNRFETTKKSFLPLSFAFETDNENSELGDTNPVVEFTELAGGLMRSLNAADMNGSGENNLPANMKKTIAPNSNSLQLSLNDKAASYMKPAIHQ